MENIGKLIKELQELVRLWRKEIVIQIKMEIIFNKSKIKLLHKINNKIKILMIKLLLRNRLTLKNK